MTMQRITQWILPLLLITLSACGDDSASGNVAGIYQFDTVGDLYFDHLALPQPPFENSHLVIDSLKDTLTLRPDYTYRESGTMWHSSPMENASVRFQASGQYAVENGEIILTPDYGSTVGGGIATVKNGVVTVRRYPGVWIFRK
jgi:hypothetical protein